MVRICFFRSSYVHYSHILFTYLINAVWKISTSTTVIGNSAIRAVSVEKTMIGKRKILGALSYLLINSR